MKNKPYDLYELPLIRDLKDMMLQKKERRPDDIAFTYSKGRNQIVKKTYKEFYDEVNALGTWILSQSKERQHIAIIGENSYEWLVCFLAIVCGGSVAVPIDKELPAEEIVRLLKKADVKAVFYSKSYRDIAEKAIGMLSQMTGDANSHDTCLAYQMSDLERCLSEGKKMLTSGNCSFIDYRTDRKKMCCIMFTSGTSGSSKGVMLSHENIAEDINGSCRLFVLEGNTIAVLPFHHAFGLIVAVFMVFNYGYTIYINRSLKMIQKDLQIAKPQTMFLVPLFVETFHKQVWATAKKEGKEKLLKKMMKLSDFLLKFGVDVRKKIFASVRQAFGGDTEYIICGGAPLGIQYIKEFRSWGIEILNGYGTTECAPCAAVNRNHYHKDGTVGVAVPGVHMNIGEDGEVFIKGPIVMMGYYRDGKATNEVLKDGWYATGDLGMIDKDGFITLIGRKKNLIILSNGENVSPEELETYFLKCEAVKEVLVYERNCIIVAEIYPNIEYMQETDYSEEVDMQKYFEQLCKEINRNRPIYKQVGEVFLRDSEFPKNTSKKILRY
ncbi:MAG: AMP-binding protein [Bacteroides sp.]